MSATLRKIGHKPPERMGNGHGLTVPQEILMVALRRFSPIAEYAVATGMARSSGHPTCYKLDLAFPSARLGVEVDGASHRLLSRRETDQKKDNLLKSFGWTVLRIPNGQVMDHLSETVTFITSKLKEITTISQKAS